MTTATGRLRGYRIIVNGWVRSLIDEIDIDNFVRALWITKEQGKEIKLLPRGDQQAADQLIERYRSELT